MEWPELEHQRGEMQRIKPGEPPGHEGHNGQSAGQTLEVGMRDDKAREDEEEIHPQADVVKRRDRRDG